MVHVELRFLRRGVSKKLMSRCGRGGDVTSHHTAPAAMIIGTTSRENKNVFLAHSMVMSRVKATRAHSSPAPPAPHMAAVPHV